MYHDKQMRRWLSISLLVLFWLTPLAALLPGSNEASLPACCRRHGVHHCVMSAPSAQAAGSAHLLSAPSRCSQFPAFPFAAQADFALTHPILPAPHGDSPLHFTTPGGAGVSQPLAATGRAPPAFS